MGHKRTKVSATFHAESIVGGAIGCPGLKQGYVAFGQRIAVQRHHSDVGRWQLKPLQKTAFKCAFATRSCEVKSSPALGDPPEWHPVQCASSSGRSLQQRDDSSSPQGNTGSATSYVHDDNTERGNMPWRRLGARSGGRFAIWSYFLSWRCGVRKELPAHSQEHVSELIGSFLEATRHELPRQKREGHGKNHKKYAAFLTRLQEER